MIEVLSGFHHSGNNVHQKGVSIEYEIHAAETN